MQDAPADIDAIIAEEQRSFARESLGEAWADAVSEGVDTAILADAAQAGLGVAMFASVGNRADVTAGSEPVQLGAHVEGFGLDPDAHRP